MALVIILLPFLARLFILISSSKIPLDKLVFLAKPEIRLELKFGH